MKKKQPSGWAIGWAAFMAARKNVLTGVVAAEENAALASALGVDVDVDGFLRAADEAVAPVRSRCDGSGPRERQCEGVFICGSAAWPASIEDCVTQAQAAAGKASLHIFTKGPR